MRRSSRSGRASGLFPNLSKASSPGYHRLSEGVSIPEHLVDYLNTCTDAELEVFVKAYRCPICGGELVLSVKECEAEARSEHPSKGGAHGRH